MKLMNREHVQITAAELTPLGGVRAADKDWGRVIVAGVMSVVGGAVALMAPVLATGVVGTLIAVTLWIVGCESHSRILMETINPRGFDSRPEVPRSAARSSRLYARREIRRHFHVSAPRPS